MCLKFSKKTLKIVINTTSDFCEENGLWVGANREAGRPIRRVRGKGEWDQSGRGGGKRPQVLLIDRMWERKKMV